MGDKDGMVFLWSESCLESWPNQSEVRGCSGLGWASAFWEASLQFST